MTGIRRELWYFAGPSGKVSDQGSRFGLVMSVPLHICQLRTDGAAEKTAVTERPAEHKDGDSSELSDFTKDFMIF